MRQKSVPEKEPATQVVKNIRRATRRHFSAEDKIRIVLEGLRGESRRLLYLERSCGVCDRAQCNAVSTGGMPAATEPWVIQVCGPFSISTTPRRAIFGLSKRGSMRCCRRIAMLELTLASRTDASNR